MNQETSTQQLKPQKCKRSAEEIAAGVKRQLIITVRFTDDERSMINAAAKINEQTTNLFCREILLAFAKAVLSRKPANEGNNQRPAGDLPDQPPSANGDQNDGHEKQREETGDAA